MTKKMKQAGRFGVRYGTRIRKSTVAIESLQKGKHKCPSCLKMKVKRRTVGIWYCTACGLKFAGKAYKPY